MTLAQEAGCALVVCLLLLGAVVGLRACDSGCRDHLPGWLTEYQCEDGAALRIEGGEPVCRCPEAP